MHPLSIWQAVILGLVEGITEYLPVSSTGHLIIASNLMGLKDASAKDAIDAFEIVIQGGAILAVLGLYWSRFVQMLRGLIGADPAGFRLFLNVVIAFIPAAVVGLATKKYINAHLFTPVPVVAAFIIGGVYMILVDARRTGRWAAMPTPASAGRELDELTPVQALMIGLLQVFSLWPGTSRSMMTITGGLFAKLKPAAAAEFSFLLGMPTLLAATLYTAYKDIKESHAPVLPGALPHPVFYKVLGPMPVLVGIIVAGVSAAIAVKWLVGFLNRRGLAPFGVYRIILGIALTGLILGKVVTIEPENHAVHIDKTPTVVVLPSTSP